MGELRVRVLLFHVEPLPQGEIMKYALLLLCAPAVAQQYGLVDLGNVTTHGINNAGDVVGQKGSHAFLYRASNRSFVDLGTLGGSSSAAYAVNDCQAVVGQSFVKGDQAYHAMLYKGGIRTDLGVLPNQGSSSAAQGINNTGIAVGFAFLAGNGIQHATKFYKGSVTDLGPGLAITVNFENDIAGPDFIIEDSYWNSVPLQVTGMNDFADLVGDITVSGATHAALYHEGQIIDLGNLAGQPGWNSHARGINDAGEIVGISDALPPGTNQGVQRAFLFRSGTMADLTSLISASDPLATYVTLTEAAAINDSGWIAANGTDSRYGSRGYLLKRTSPAIQWTRSQGGCH